ncbi:MAG: tetratricopeptide repeat protein [Candidatus Eisenbacteria bacterium]|nr:tetratricopeptide repeat protein [Candidatus Eisenbacteria bacterium]
MTPSKKTRGASRARQKDGSDSGPTPVIRRLNIHSAWAMGLALALVVVVRLVYLATLRENPFFSDPILDSRLYDSWAVRLSSGDWLGQDPFFMAPLYPYFLALVYLVLGHNQLAAVAVQLMIGAGSCALVFLMGKRLVGIHAAVLTSVILAFYGPLLFFDGLLLAEFLGIFTNLVWLYVLARPEQDFRARTFFVAGLFLGLSMLVRASAIIFFPVILLWLALFSGVPRRKRWAYFGTLVLGACLTVAPVTIRNYVRGNDLVLITSNGGLNFYIGNNENADGLYSKPIKELHLVGADPESDATGRYYAEKTTGRKLKPSEVSAFWFEKAFQFVKSRPRQFVALNLKKLLLFWNSHEFPQIEDYRIWQSLFPAPIPLISFWFVGPLGLAGVILTVKKTRKFFLLHMFLLAYTISICAFFVTARYRVQVVPVLSIFSAYFLWWCVERVLGKSYKALAGALALVVLLSVVTGRPALTAMGIRPSSDSWYSHFYKGTKFLAHPNTLDEAIRELSQAVRLNQRNPEAFNNLGLGYEKKGMMREAVWAFERALAADSTYVEAWYNLAFLRQGLGDYPAAAALYHRVIGIQPYLPRAHFNLGICLFRQGRLEDAAEELRVVLELEPTNEEAHNQLGIILGEQGDIEGAIRQFEEALRDKPGYEAARRNLNMLLDVKSGGGH